MSEIVTINRHKDFNRAYKKGKSFVCPLFVLYISKNYNRGIRLGITTSKKIGKAVYRNRARRILKEAFRQVLPELKGNFDVVFVARSKTPFFKAFDVKSKMVDFFKEFKILKNWFYEKFIY